MLKKLLLDNGYYDFDQNKYYFYVKDHLGNNRIVADQNGMVVQQTDYYPFGMPTSLSMGEGVQPYKFGGKEYDTNSGLDLYDFHARQYDPILARFTSVDPMAEKYYSISPYVYCANNPLKYIDPDGKMLTWPPGNFMGINWQQAANQQVIDKAVVDAAKPSAISVGVSVGISAGLTVQKGGNATLILRGDDKGRIIITEDKKVGVSTPGVSISAGVGVTQADPNKFDRSSLIGKSETTSTSITTGGPVSVGTSNTESKTADGSEIRSSEINISGGKGGGAIDVSKTINRTEEHIVSKVINKIIDFFQDGN